MRIDGCGSLVLLNRASEAFVTLQVAPLYDWQTGHRDAADADALHRHDGQSNHLAHMLDLARQHALGGEAQPRLVLPADLHWRQRFAVERQAVIEQRQTILDDRPRHFDDELLLHARRLVHQLARDAEILGINQQAAGHGGQRIGQRQPSQVTLEEARSARRGVVRLGAQAAQGRRALAAYAGVEARRLVQQYRHRHDFQQGRIGRDVDALLLGDARARLLDDDTVHADPATLDIQLGLAPRAWAHFRYTLGESDGVVGGGVGHGVSSK